MMTSRIRRLVLSCLAGIGCLVAGPVFAQSTWTDPLGSLVNPESRTYYSLQTMQGRQFGGQQPYFSAGASHWLGEIDDQVTLLNAQALINNNGNPGGTAGFQQRWLTDVPMFDASILGAGVYFDASQSRYGNLYQQFNVNLELYTQSKWYTRANAYLPIGRINANTGPLNAIGGPGQLNGAGASNSGTAMGGSAPLAGGGAGVGGGGGGAFVPGGSGNNATNSGAATGGTGKPEGGSNGNGPAVGNGGNG